MQKNTKSMLGIDSKRESVKGNFAKKIWDEVLKIWRNETVEEVSEKNEPKYQVEWP